MITDLEKAKKLKSKLQKRELCLGVQIVLSDPAAAEILGRVGYDWLVIDTEHAANDAATVRSMLQAAARTEAVVLARPLRFDPDEIRRLLDVGSPGILCPFINTGDEAIAWCRHVVTHLRHSRLWPPPCRHAYGLDADEYFQAKRMTGSMICIRLIESQRECQEAARRHC